MGKPSARADSKPLYYSAAEFSDNAGAVFHGFFGRRGGVSRGVYNSLNCGPGSDDEPEAVKENRKTVADIVGVNPINLLSMYQLHGATCLKVNEAWPSNQRPEADAMVTEVPGLALSILTADCAPVLLKAKTKKKVVIGAAHAGWGGAFKGVLESVVAGMEELGARREDITACIGPCIHKNSYEVSEEFYECFVTAADENERFFQSVRKPGHYMFDLAGYCALRLAQAGVKKVHIKDLDTYFNEEDFFSYRRATHRGEKDYGRQISAILIK